jgi:hypothetical protein
LNGWEISFPILTLTAPILVEAERGWKNGRSFEIQWNHRVFTGLRAASLRLLAAGLPAFVRPTCEGGIENPSLDGSSKRWFSFAK